VPGWTTRLASGWRGQRIAIIPEEKVVVTITADIEDGSEGKVFAMILSRFIACAVARGEAPGAPNAQERLATVLDEVRRITRIRERTETRMLPSPSPKEKEKRRPFVPIR